MSTRTRLTAGMVAGCLFAAAGLAAGGTAAASVADSARAAGPARLPGHLHQLSGQPQLALAARAVPAAKTASVARWTKTALDGANTYTYTMVGKDPTVTQSIPSTTVKAVLVPVIIKFANGDTWNPTVGDTCDTTSALTRTQNSPIFKNAAYTLGGTAVGTGQYVDTFQRANYWTYTSPTGINPGYHVKLGLSVHAAVTINVPNADAAVGTTGCGNQLLGAVEVSWLDGYLQNTLIPSLGGAGVTVKMLPIFLLGNVVEYQGTTTNCCILGYHNVVHVPTGLQTYALSMYDNTGDFSGSHDVSALSHEVGEWMDDPMVNNPTKPWGHIDQVTSCQTNLEVGDPLSGTVQVVTTGGHAYHVQELAFTSWFYHQSPSTGIHGWYSDYGTFTSPAAACA
jgi:hypothetical protein